MNTILNLSVFVALLALSVGLGYTVLLCLKPRDLERPEAWLLSLAIGYGGLIAGTAAMGFLHVLAPGALRIFLLACSPVAVWGFVNLLRFHAPGWQAANVTSGVLPMPLIFGALIAYGLLYLLSTLTPPMDGDTLHSYLDVPRQFVDAGGIISLPYEHHGALPMNMYMLSALALMVRGDELAQMLVGFGMAAGCGAALYLFGRRYLTREMGLLAALLFLSMNAVQALVPSTKVNLGGSFFDLVAVYAFFRWCDVNSADFRWLVLAGIMSGLALGTFYCAGFTIVVLAGYLLWKTRRQPIRGLRLVFMYGAIVTVLASPWLIRNFTETGNPFFPILNSFFDLPKADPIRHAEGILGLFTILWDMSTGYIAYPYGKPVGPLVLALLPALWWARPVPRFVKTVLILLIPLYLLWYSGVQRPRNFLMPLGLLTLVSSFVYVTLCGRQKLLRVGFMGIFLLYLSVDMAGLVRAEIANAAKLRYIFGRDSRQEYLSSSLNASFAYPNSGMCNYMNNRLPVESRIAALYLGNGYYVKPAFLDSRMLDLDFMHDTAKNKEELVVQWQRAGITHVFYNEPYVKKVIGSNPEEWPMDYKLFIDPSFSAYLREIYNCDHQYLFEFQAYSGGLGR